jgi:hypothetical protein
VLPAAVTGCAALGYPTGSIYTGTDTPHGMQRLQGGGANKGGTARGEACATGILGLVAFGDASLAAAKKAGGITDVHSVEYSGTSILGIYSRGCTVAIGPGGGGGGEGEGGGGGGGGGGGSSGSQGGQGTKAGGSGGQGQGSSGALHGSGSGVSGPGGSGKAGTDGTGTDHPGAGPGTRGVLPTVDLGPTYTQVPYSFLFDARSNDRNHSCESFDPSRPSALKNAPQYPYLKPFKDLVRANDGQFVDACPKQDLVAICDTSEADLKTLFFYKGFDPVALEAHRTFCPKWTWVIPPAAVPKPPPDTDTLALACDPRPKDKPETSWTTMAAGCIELRPDADPSLLKVVSGTPFCKGPALVQRCPTQGMTGRCDAGKGGIHFYYGQQAATGKLLCLNVKGAWSAP